MTALRRCDHVSCEKTRVDEPPGLSGYIPIPIDGRTHDLCPDCTSELQAWLAGDKELIPTNRHHLVPFPTLTKEVVE